MSLATAMALGATRAGICAPHDRTSPAPEAPHASFRRTSSIEGAKLGARARNPRALSRARIAGHGTRAVAASSKGAAKAAAKEEVILFQHKDLAVASKKKNLVLIGGRGCGKSSICRRIQASDKRFKLFSLDELIPYEAEGASIPEIVEAQGWPAFRDIEYDTCRKVGAINEFALVDCGGGVVVDLDAEGTEYYSERKVDALKENGIVVYISRDVEYLIGRIEGDSNRPSLSATTSFKEIMDRREKWYRQAADHVIECRGMKKIEIARKILKILP